MHPSFVLEIAHQQFSGHQLKAAVEQGLLPLAEGWQVAIAAFLKQWLDESEEITSMTSGSTGMPQMIPLKKATMRVSAAMTCDFFRLQPGDRAVLCLSAENIAGKMMLVRAMERGLHLIAVSPTGCPISDIAPGVRFAAMVPLQVQRCLQQHCLTNTDIVLIGGAAVSDRMVAELQEVETACYSSYGMTETMSHVAIKRLNGPDASEWFEGLNGIRFQTDSRGCLQVEAPGLGIARLQTNDLVELDGDQRFRWLGRVDFVINSGGIKVIPEQLEKVLSPWLALPFFITGLPHEELGEQVAVFVETNEPEHFPMQQMLQALQHWPRYQRPKTICCMASFVYTSSGKVNRGATKVKAITEGKRDQGTVVSFSIR